MEQEHIKYSELTDQKKNGLCKNQTAHLQQGTCLVFVYVTVLYAPQNATAMGQNTPHFPINYLENLCGERGLPYNCAHN
jgi:hypothetical protein